MKVLFDDQIFRLQRRGGISRYFVELIRAFQGEQDQITCHYPGRWSDNEHVIEAGLARRLPELPIPPSLPKVPVGARRLVQRTLLGKNGVPRSAGQQSDVYHPTYYLKKRFIRTAAPVVVTAYDMIPERLPELFTRNPHREKDWYLRKASGVIAISRSTADDVGNLMPNLAAPVRVIHLGVDSTRFLPKPITTPKEHTGPPVALFVGNRTGYKDFNVLLRAIAQPTLHDVRIVAVGPPGPTGIEHQRMSDLRVSDRVRFVTPNDDELPSLYRSADVFVFPSRYEGFGLPTLEAMACGTPVILARSSSHPEVGGNAAAYFAPGDCEALAHEVESVLSDTVRRETMRRAGLSRARSLTWRSTAEQTLEFYREVIG
jgi:glycosyltransferase involved in cell wall biosynthesis